MEKRSPLFYASLFLFVILAVSSFSAGTLGISDFIENDKPISFFTEYAVSSLCAVAFIASYFIFTLGIPFGMPLPVKPALSKSTSLGFIAHFIWLVLQLVLMVLNLLNRDHPVRPLLQAVVSYNFAGMFFAWASNRINAMKKT